MYVVILYIYNLTFLNSILHCFHFQFVLQGMIGMLVKLSSGSYLGFRTLYELKICIILKDILATYDVPHGVSSPRLADGHCIQVV